MVAIDSWTYGYVLEGFGQACFVSCYNDYIGAFLGEELGNTAAHACRGAGKEEGLESRQ